MLLLLALGGVLLLGAGTWIALRSEQALLVSEREQVQRGSVEDAAKRLLTHASARMVAVRDGPPEMGAHFGLSNAIEPLLLLIGNAGQLEWPHRLPVIRREDLRERLSDVDRDAFDVLLHAVSKNPESEATMDLIQAHSRGPSKPLSALAGFLILHRGDAPPHLRQDQAVHAASMLETDPSEQISAHRYWLRSELLRLALDRDDAGMARNLLEQALMDLVGFGLSEPTLAFAWMEDLSTMGSSSAELQARIDEVNARLQSTNSRLKRYSGLLSAAGSGKLFLEQGALTSPWEGEGLARLGTRVVLPPEDPTFDLESIDATHAMKLVSSQDSQSGFRVRLAPTFPNHSLILDAPAQNTLPWQTILTASFLALGFTIALIGVLVSFKGVASRERAIAERAELLGTLSHQLKTPAANVRLFTETLMLPDLKAEERARMESILHEEALRLQDVLGRILAYQSTSERPGIELESIDTEKLLKEREERWIGNAKRRQVSLQLRVTSGLDVMGDRQSLLDALDNLVDNALSATEKGGAVVVGVESKETAVCFFVEDDGHGISPEDLPRIFDRFYRGRTKRALSGSGSGLGLAIVAAVAVRHGGVARVASTSSRGTRMELLLETEDHHGTDPACRG
jgi:hypothetical protein